MDRWKSRGGKSQRREEKKREDQREMRDEKLHAIVARSTFPSQNGQHTHRPCLEHFWKLRCRKGARCCGAKHISKSKCAKHHVWSTFGSWDVEKVHAVVGAKHIPKSKCTKHTSSGPLLEVEMSKKCARLRREAHFQVKRAKYTMFQIFFGSWDVAKVRVVRSTFPSEHVKITMLRPLLKVQMWFRVIGARDFAHCQKWAKCGVLCMSKSDGMHGTFAEDLQRCMSRDRRSTRDMFIRDRNVRRSGRWFPERGCILEHQICRFAKMILRDRCGTSYDLASIFRGRRSALHRWSGQIAKRIGTRPSAPHSIFFVWRKSRRFASFLMMLSTSKIEDVSQNSFVFDVVKFKHWGGLGEWLRFQACRQRDRETEG